MEGKYRYFIPEYIKSDVNYNIDYFSEEEAYSSYQDKSVSRKSKHNNLSRTCRPYTIKQLMGVNIKEEGSAFFIDNKEVTDVVIVGILRSISKNDKSISFVVEDGTGVIDARVWELEAVDENVITPNMYVRVCGRLHSFNKQLSSVSARNIFAIKDPNEITHHLLECIYAFLKGKAETAPGISDSKVHPVSDSPEVSIVRRAIYECSIGQAGAYVHSVVVQLQGRMQEERIMEIINDLMNQSKIYNTVDNQHFAIVEDN